MSARRARYVAHVVHHAPRPTPATLAQLLDGFRVRRQAAWPSQQWLATELGVSVRTIRRWTDQLVAEGVLKVTKHNPHHDHITGRWRRRTHRYRCRFAQKPRPWKPRKARSHLADISGRCMSPHGTATTSAVAVGVPPDVEQAAEPPPTPSLPPWHGHPTRAAWLQSLR